MLILVFIGCFLIARGLEAENGKPKIVSHKSFWIGLLLWIPWFISEIHKIISHS